MHLNCFFKKIMNEVKDYHREIYSDLEAIE